METSTRYVWETVEADAAVPLNQAEIDKTFDEIVAPAYASSGWICSLTIECGTFVCACW